MIFILLLKMDGAEDLNYEAGQWNGVILGGRVSKYFSWPEKMLKYFSCIAF